MIKDSARPAYWVPDAESPNCFICKAVFGRAEELEMAKNSGERGKPKGGNISKSDARSSGSSNEGTAPRTRAVDGPGDCRRHHCRRCGQAICSSCSKRRMPVLERGWQTDVRVCDACACVPSGSQNNSNSISSAISDAINEDEAVITNGLNEDRRASNRSSNSSSDYRNCNASDDVKAKSEWDAAHQGRPNTQTHAQPNSDQSVTIWSMCPGRRKAPWTVAAHRLATLHRTMWYYIFW